MRNRTYVCPHCDKTFAYKFNLGQHMLKHTGDFPYSCAHCPKKFARRDVFERHRQQHDSAGEPKRRKRRQEVMLPVPTGLEDDEEDAEDKLLVTETFEATSMLDTIAANYEVW